MAAESAPTADSLKAVAEAFVSASPSDSVLAGLSDEDLVTASVRCIGLENRTYCLHVGWVEQTPTAGQLRAVVIAQASEAKTATSGDAVPVGDTPLATQVRAWAQQPRATRIAQERVEVDRARKALGKVKLYDYLIAGEAVPNGFWQKYPETARWGIPLVASRGDFSTNSVGSWYGYIGDPNRAQKQITSYYCGPASMVAFAWNDPVRGNELSPFGFATQDFWAWRLGTTTNGTAISSIAANINEHLTGKQR